MIIVKDNFQLQPLLDVINNHHLSNDLCEAIEQYIIENKQRTIINGENQDVFYVSGLAKHHHNRLREYINQTIFKFDKVKAVLTSGLFMRHPNRHFWLMIGDLIIDITINQFSRQPLGLPDQLKTLADCHCFICDNPKNVFYALYSIRN